MEPMLTPELALGYLRELSTDVMSGIVLTADGDRLAGPAGLRAPGRRLRAACPDAVEAVVPVEVGMAFLAASATHVVIVATGPLALPGLVRHDLTEVLGLLAGAPGPGAAPPSRVGEERPAAAAQAPAMRIHSGDIAVRAAGPAAAHPGLTDAEIATLHDRAAVFVGLAARY